jgi:hypothetical protein
MQGRISGPRREGFEPLLSLLTFVIFVTFVTFSNVRLSTFDT